MRKKHLYRTLLLSNILLVLANPDFHEGKVSADEKVNSAETELQLEISETPLENSTNFQIPEANPYTAPPSLPQEAPKSVENNTKTSLEIQTVPQSNEVEFVTETAIGTNPVESEKPVSKNPFHELPNPDHDPDKNIEITADRDTKLPKSENLVSNRPFRRVSNNDSDDVDPKFEEKVQQYLTNLTPEEHQLLQASPDLDSKRKIFEDILVRQINEEYSLKELEEFKKSLTEQQVAELEQASNLVAFETTLKTFHQTAQAQRDFENLLDHLILESTEEEIKQLQTASINPDRFTQTILELSAQKSQTTTSTKPFRVAAAIPLLIKAAPYIIAGAKALGSVLVAKGIAYLGSQAINYSYQQVQAQAAQRQRAQYAAMAKSYTNQQARIQAISQAQSYTYTAPGQYAIQHYTYQPTPSYGYSPSYSYAPQSVGSYAAPTRAYGQVAANVFYYTGVSKLPVYNLSGVKHTVLPNESVWSISQKYNIQMNDLVIWNGLTNGLIHPGQKVVVKPDTLINNGLQHQVLPNESVWSISHKYGIAMADFVAWNNIQQNTIHPGQKVYVKPKSWAQKARYIVKAGDTLWRIAKEHGVTIDDLVRWNKVSNFTIHPGDALITTQPPINPTPAVITKQPLPQLGALYTVKAGDSIWKIANDHKITMQELLDWNQISNQTIHPGQQLITQNPTTTTRSNSTKTYTVKTGDSVWKIATSHGISMDDLVKWNNISNFTIYPGQQLTVQKPTTTSTITADKSYTVKAGDSVWKIANDHGVSMDDLVKWNNISNFTIHPGEVLILKQPTEVPYFGLTTHTVQAGESVWLIAQKYDITMDELVEWNNISNFAIHPGQRVITGRKPTNAEARAQAKKLGYTEYKGTENSRNALIFKRKKGKGPRFISPDQDVHNGGYWKGGDDPKRLNTKPGRSGTYDKNLNIIKD